jgi:small subunit ribosomal protein S6
MRPYQLTYLISPDVSEEELEGFLQKISSFIQETGGKIKKSENPLKKRLKYLVKEKDKAYLLNTKFYFEPDKLEDLDKKLKKEPLLLRHLILTDEKPSERIKIPTIKPKVKVKKEKKVELKKIDEKLDEILGEM